MNIHFNKLSILKVKKQYNLSIVLPFYKRYNELVFAFDKNQRFYQPNYQIVLVLDEPSQKELILSFVKSKKDIVGWKVLLNEQNHDWRNPTKAINVGIRNADSDVVLIMSPETIMCGDIIKKLMLNICSPELSSFSVGTVYYCDIEQMNNYLHDGILLIENYAYLGFYGSIMFYKKYADLIGGYDEEFELWGGDDDDFRKRMLLNGAKKIDVSDVVCLHLEHEKVNKNQIWNNYDIFEMNKKIYSVDNYKANEGVEWGKSFDKIIFRS